VTPRIRNVPLAAEFQLSSRPHNMMLKRLALKSKRKIRVVGPEINIQLPGFIAIRILDTVQNELVLKVDRCIFEICVYGRVKVRNIQTICTFYMIIYV
jgi:hypothetical protein